MVESATVCHSKNLPWYSHAFPISASLIIFLPFRPVFGIFVGEAAAALLRFLPLSGFGHGDGCG